LTLQVSNIARDRETWRRPVTPKTHRGVCPAWPAKGNKVREGHHTGIRTPTGVRHSADARTGIWRRQKQSQQATGLQAETRTTTNAERITETGGRAGAHKIQVWHYRQGQHHEHEENQVQDAGGKRSTGSEDKKKAGATSGLSKEQHRQSPRTKAAMTQKDSEPHNVDYTRVGFKTLHFL